MKKKECVGSFVINHSSTYENKTPFNIKLENLRKYRFGAQLYKKEVSELLNFSHPQLYYKYEQGDTKNPSIDLINNLCNLYFLSSDYFFSSPISTYKLWVPYFRSYHISNTDNHYVFYNINYKHLELSLPKEEEPIDYFLCEIPSPNNSIDSTEFDDLYRKKIYSLFFRYYEAERKKALDPLYNNGKYSFNTAIDNSFHLLMKKEEGIAFVMEDHLDDIFLFYLKSKTKNRTNCIIGRIVAAKDNDAKKLIIIPCFYVTNKDNPIEPIEDLSDLNINDINVIARIKKLYKNKTNPLY